MKRISLIAFVLLAASQAQAFKAKPGFVKVELAAAQDIVSPMPVADLLAHFGGDDVADYGAFHIVYLPKGLLVAFEKSANAGGLRVRVRDDLDVINAPGASVDAREGIHGNPGNLIRSYAPGRRGLYLLQFIGPVNAEWSAALRDLGWTVVGYLPSDAYILAGKPSLSASPDAAFPAMMPATNVPCVCMSQAPQLSLTVAKIVPQYSRPMRSGWFDVPVLPLSRPVSAVPTRQVAAGMFAAEHNEHWLVSHVAYPLGDIG